MILHGTRMSQVSSYRMVLNVDRSCTVQVLRSDMVVLYFVCIMKIYKSFVERLWREWLWREWLHPRKKLDNQTLRENCSRQFLFFLYTMLVCDWLRCSARNCFRISIAHEISIFIFNISLRTASYIYFTIFFYIKIKLTNTSVRRSNMMIWCRWAMQSKKVSMLTGWISITKRLLWLLVFKGVSTLLTIY